MNSRLRKARSRPAPTGHPDTRRGREPAQAGLVPLVAAVSTARRRNGGLFPIASKNRETKNRQSRMAEGRGEGDWRSIQTDQQPADDGNRRRSLRYGAWGAADKGEAICSNGLRSASTPRQASTSAATIISTAPSR